MNTDIITRYVMGYGWLPMVIVDGKEQYRGEFQATAEGAFDKAYAFATTKGFVKS